MNITDSQKEQIEQFAYLFNEHFDNVELNIIVDNKTKEERLGICIVTPDKDDPNVEQTHLLGLWFLPNDVLFDRFQFKVDEPEIMTRKPPWWKKLLFWK